MTAETIPATLPPCPSCGALDWRMTDRGTFDAEWSFSPDGRSLNRIDHSETTDETDFFCGACRLGHPDERRRIPAEVDDAWDIAAEQLYVAKDAAAWVFDPHAKADQP